MLPVPVSGGLSRSRRPPRTYDTIATLGMSAVHSPGVSDDLEALDRAVEAVHAAATDGDKVLLH